MLPHDTVSLNGKNTIDILFSNNPWYLKGSSKESLDISNLTYNFYCYMKFVKLIYNNFVHFFNINTDNGPNSNLTDNRIITSLESLDRYLVKWWKCYSLQVLSIKTPLDDIYVLIIHSFLYGLLIPGQRLNY